MKKQEVDARVQAAIENVRAGRTVEDDTSIEFKADWPDPVAKARQLAGAANAIRGDALIYVIGVDDKTGAVTIPAKTEPQEWFAKICKPFDQIAPELLWSQTIFVGEQQESVVALVFDTSQFPYVINVKDANRREVPMRVASGTESSHRNQLIRMFEPTLRPPVMSIPEASVMADWKDEPKTRVGVPQAIGRTQRLRISVNALVLVEHFGPHPTTMPIRDMRLRLTSADLEIRPEVRIKQLGHSNFPVVRRLNDPAPSEPVPPTHGVYARDNYVVATAPGDFALSAKHTLQSEETDEAALLEVTGHLKRADHMQLDLALRVVGVPVLLKLTCSLRRTAASSTATEQHRMGKGEVRNNHLGTWEIPATDLDPWA